MKTCKICGAQLEDYAAFCVNCGSIINDTPSQQPVAENNFYSQPEAVAEEVAETPETLIANYINDVEVAEKKSKTTFIISVAVAAVMVLSLCGVSLIGIFNLLGLFVTVPAIAVALFFAISTFLKTKLNCPETDITSIDAALLADLQNAQKKSAKIKSKNAISITAVIASTVIFIYTIAAPIIALIASAIITLINSLF